MNKYQILINKILTLNDLLLKIKNWRDNGDIIVFTNGCFDLTRRTHRISNKSR